MKISKIQVRKLPAGFTLVELLVVIGILAILISALIVAIDPLQQLSKSRDVGYKKATSDFVNVVSAYNLQKGKFPWDKTAAAATDAYKCNTQLTSAGGSGVFTAKQLSLLTNCIAEIKSASEIRAGFLDDTSTISKLYVTGDTNTGIVKVCYLPTAASNKLFAQGAKYTQAGVIDTIANCPDDNTNVCYYCVQ